MLVLGILRIELKRIIKLQTRISNLQFQEISYGNFPFQCFFQGCLNKWVSKRRKITIKLLLFITVSFCRCEVEMYFLLFIFASYCHIHLE